MQTTQLSATQLMGEFLGSENGKITRKISSSEFSDELNVQRDSILGGTSALGTLNSATGKAGSSQQAGESAIRFNSILGGAATPELQERGTAKSTHCQSERALQIQKNGILGGVAPEPSETLESASTKRTESASSKMIRSHLFRRAHRLNQSTKQGQEAALPQKNGQSPATETENKEYLDATKKSKVTPKTEESNGDDIIYVDALLVERIMTQLQLPAEQKAAIQAAADSTGRVLLKDLRNILNDPASRLTTPLAQPRVAAEDIQKLVNSFHQGKGEATSRPASDLQVKPKGSYDLGEFKGLLNHIATRVAQEKLAAKDDNLVGIGASSADTATDATHQSVAAAKSAGPLQRPTHNLVPSFSLSDNAETKDLTGATSLFQDSSREQQSQELTQQLRQHMEGKMAASNPVQTGSPGSEQKTSGEKPGTEEKQPEVNSSYDRQMKESLRQEFAKRSGNGADNPQPEKRNTMPENLTMHQQPGKEAGAGQKDGFVPIFRTDMQTANPHPGVDGGAETLSRSHLSVNEPGWTEKLAQHMRSLEGQDRNHLTLELEPKELGRLSVRIETQHNQVTAFIVADSERARALLMQNTSLLHNSLHEQGLVLDQIAVDVRQDSTDQQMSRHARRDTRKRRTGTSAVPGVVTPAESAARIQPQKRADQIISLFT